ncbi:MAG: hypothetical protein ACRCXZ_04375, partial [Patescibacteria group bacterium]
MIITKIPLFFLNNYKVCFGLLGLPLVSGLVGLGLLVDPNTGRSWEGLEVQGGGKPTDYSKVNNAISYEASKESMEKGNKSITPEANTQPEFSNSNTTNEIITPPPKAKTVVIPTESVTDPEAGSVEDNNQSETVVPKVIPTPVAKSKAATSANSDIKKVV